MFTNLIESDSHRNEFKRRGSFFLATVVTYGLILFAAGVASIYAYDARLEAQVSSLELLNWVPPITTATERPRHETTVVRRPQASNAPVDRTASVPMRTQAVAPPTDPTKVPDDIGTKGSDVPPVTGHYVLGNKNVDPPIVGTDNQTGCIACNGTPAVVKLDDEKPPPPNPPVKPQLQRLPSKVLASKAVSLPQPPYPPMALQVRAQGAVNVQILVDEQGKVVTAQAVSGNPLLTAAARDAAMRARFTPTILNGQPVKVQGVITYNFVLQ